MKDADHYGYYLFLGVGDYEAAPSIGSSWTSRWDLAEWRRRIDSLVRLGTDTLFIFLTGDDLPFLSEHYPECAESGHPNVTGDFFQQVLDHALEKNVEVVAVFSTTGHARGYARTRPELSTHNRQGRLQVGSGVLCHNQQDARRYPRKLIEECLTRYHGFSGVVLHPPEFTDPCFCGTCQARYRDETGADLLSATDQAASGFFMQTSLSFQKGDLEPVVKRLLPGGRRLTFTVPWVFEDHFEEIASQIPSDTIIVDWDYDLSDDRIRALQSRLKRYQRSGHSVWFMPTCGYGITSGAPAETQENAVLSQVRLALDAGARGIVYFMGSHWSPHVDETSHYLNS